MKVSGQQNVPATLSAGKQHLAPIGWVRLGEIQLVITFYTVINDLNIIPCIKINLCRHLIL